MSSLIQGTCTKDITIYFPQFDSNKAMGQAFNACDKASYKCWIVPKEDVYHLPHHPNVIFVLQVFEGELFDFLKSKKCLVVGPFCLLKCLTESISVPSSAPIFCLAMKRVVATTSKLPKPQNEEMSRLISYMGGVYRNDLTPAVTHLITEGGFSNKYKSSVNHKIPVMSCSWVKAVWEASQTRDVNSESCTFLSHRLPLFKGLFITCTKFPSLVKLKLLALIEAHGGVYMATLEKKKTSILIAEDMRRKKCQFAKLWGIPCLKPSWIYESSAQGIPARIKDHLILDQEPESCMNNIDNPDLPIEPEEIFENHVSDKNFDLPSTLKSRNDRVNTDYNELLDHIDLSNFSQSGLFLDGCKVYLSGFTSGEMEKLKKVLNRGGATHLTQITERLSHIVVGQFMKNEAQILAQLDIKPPTVSLKWLIASIQMKSPAPVEAFPSFTLISPPPALSPCCNKGVMMLKSQTPVRKTKTVSKLEFVPSPQIETGDSLITRRAQMELKLLRGESDANDEIEKAQDEIDTEIQPIFKGLTFSVSSNFEESSAQIIEFISNLEGEVEKSKRGVDYTIVPFISSESQDSETVTTLWIDDCFENDCVVQVEYFHRPIAPPEGSPLNGSVLSISGFKGKERVFISHVAAALGALVQDSLSLKDRPEKKIFKSTELICETLSGRKYNAALKWGIPTFDKDWLLSRLQITEQNQTKDSISTENNQKEEGFEWGNERGSFSCFPPGTIESGLTKAAYQWRIRRSHLSKPSAFRNFQATICTEERRGEQYKRLLQAGGATILNQTDIFDSTHVFWDGMVKLPVTKASLAAQNVLLLKPIFLADYLIQMGAPNIEDYSIR